MLPEGSSVRPPADMKNAGMTILSLIDRRDATDRRMSIFWAAIPACFLSMVVFTILSYIRAAFDLYGHGWDEWVSDVYIASYLVGLPLFGILFGLMTYKMINRLNMHTNREDTLRAAVMSYLRGAAGSAGKEQQIVTELLQMSAFDGQAVTYEKKHNPRTWALGIALLLMGYPVYALFALFLHSTMDGAFAVFMLISLLASLTQILSLIASAYIVNSMMRTAYTHDVRWRGFTTSTMLALHRLGKTDSNMWRHAPVKDRSMILYVIFAIVTAGFFLFYWFYVLVDDTNKHFKQQHLFEDMLKKIVLADMKTA
jgi:hypothetical protein